MSEEKFPENKNGSRWKKILLSIAASPVNSLFGAVVLFYAARIFIFGQDTLLIKLEAGGVVFLWLLWTFAKSLIKILLFVALLAAGAFEYYQYSHRNEIACEDNGGRWNSERETCEEKSSLWQQVGRWLKN
jgi:hypothetical protein